METDRLLSAYYTPSHEWLLPVDEGVRLGITKYAQQQLGEIVFVELPIFDRTYQINQTICVVESIKTASEIDAPFPCTIVEINHDLSENPSLLNSSPQSNGWICIVKPNIENWQSQLMSESAYVDAFSNGNSR